MEGTENSFELVESDGALDLVPKRELEAWWFLVGAGALLVLISIVLLVKRKSAAVDPNAAKREAYEEALGNFEKIDDKEVRETAVDVSYVLRRYLAKSLGEPALFETHEELIARSDALSVLPENLREEAGGFFAKLARCKYAPDFAEAGITASEMKSEGRELLERMNRA